VAIREYFSEKFSINANSYTSRDLLDYMGKKNIDQSIAERLKAAFSDIEKFAYSNQSVSKEKLLRDIEEVMKELDKNA